MATSTRQYGRRGISNTTNQSTGGFIPSFSTVSATVPPRRYVLDIPSSRTQRASRTSRVNDVYRETNKRSRSAGTTNYSTVVSTSGDNGQITRSDTRDYYYRDYENDPSTTTVNRYFEDGTTKRIIESGSSYTNVAADDQEIQAITAQATPDIKNYPINVDSNPEIIVRPNTERLQYTQDIAIRYLKPSTPPPPGPIIIREIRAPAPPPAPPIILRQRPPPPRTPSPIIIREKPPPRPKSVPTTVIKKIIPPPPPPPRKLIIERLPQLPPKPRPVIIERWLPYHKQKRQVIHEKAKPLEPTAHIKNTIIEWRSPDVEVVKQVKKYGVQDADPQRYYTQYGDKLYTTDFVQRKLTELGLQEELALIQEQQNSMAKDEMASEQAEEYNVRQILNSIGPTVSSRQTYTTADGNTVTRVNRSASHSGLVDEYGEREVIYNRSTTNRTNSAYDENNYNFDQSVTRTPILTEEYLLKSHSNGKFPTHLLTKLGSQVYDMPSDQIDSPNYSTRTTTTTKTRYYTVNQPGSTYESAVDEATPTYTEDKYVQIKTSDLNNVLSNYDVYSNTGQKLEGEQITF